MQVSLDLCSCSTINQHHTYSVIALTHNFLMQSIYWQCQRSKEKDKE
jgi:hypothetical protein